MDEFRYKPNASPARMVGEAMRVFHKKPAKAQLRLVWEATGLLFFFLPSTLLASGLSIYLFDKAFPNVWLR